ncbi:AraC family transcriptional regulator ligand-binding domain-containing protein [Cribrihabitans pelagius]|uniref:AraC family transcriptional regulator n=1 Tax=Cribrihabitans pelagius TaxID=1765746 RepID=UPI003B5BE240
MHGIPAPSNAVFAQQAARRLLAEGHAPAAVFEGTGFGPALAGQEAPAADFATIAAFFEHAAELSGDRLFGFRLGCGTDLRSAGLLGYIARSAPTAGAFLEAIGRYAGVLSDALEPDTAQLWQDGIFAWRCTAASGAAGRHYAECLAAALLAGLRSAAQAQIAPRAAQFAHPRVRGASEISAWFGAPVRFGASSSRMVFSLADLARPLATADAMLEQVLCTYGDQILASRLPPAAGLRSQVERAVAARLSDGPVTLAAVAADLGMSPRSLSRKLALLGTSYFTIVEELRKSLALRYLRDSSLGLAGIAFLLGYAGLGSFNDAFKRWTGRSPGQYRAALHSGEDADEAGSSGSGSANGSGSGSGTASGGGTGSGRAAGAAAPA